MSKKKGVRRQPLQFSTPLANAGVDPAALDLNLTTEARGDTRCSRDGLEGR